MNQWVVIALLLVGSAFAAKIGEKISPFKLTNQLGSVVDETVIQGKTTVLYFYPKDDTPGCTVEAKNFKKDFEEFKALGVLLYGVSTQSQKSHQEFKQKYDLPFDLLVDDSGKFGDQFGISTIPVIGLYKRKTVLISDQGKILKIYDDVSPETHSKEILEDIKKMRKK